MTEDNWKRLTESGVLARYEKKYRVEIDGHLMSTNDKRLIIRGHKEAVTEVAKLLQRPVDEQIPDNSSSKPTVTISEETWRLLEEYNALTGFKRGLKVDVTARHISNGQCELTLSGPKRGVDRLSGWLQYAPRKLELPSDAMAPWLLAKGSSGTARIGVICAAHNVQHAMYRRIGLWLFAKKKGSDTSRSEELNKKFDTHISVGQSIEGDRTQTLELTFFAECSENIERVFAQLDGLHKEYFEIDRATGKWLINKRKGAEDARANEFDAEFDSCLSLLSDPAEHVSDTIGVEILGENEDFVQAYKRMIGKRSKAIVVEKVNVSKLQFEFWFGHDGEQTRDRPHHKLEDDTDTTFLEDIEAGSFHVAGRPNDVKEAVESINKTRHIKLFTSEISMALSNYIASVRLEHEKDGVIQIHFASGDVRSGSRKFRRLHRMNSEKDDDHALASDNDLMRKLDLHEIVLEVPRWAIFIMKDCPKIEETTATGMHFSNDAQNGRVLVDIAGSTSSVKRGMKEVIGRITSHRLYKQGDICLRRIREQHVDTAGFKKTRDAKSVNLSSCMETFSWERLTRERWCYVGEPSGGRRPRGSQ